MKKLTLIFLIILFSRTSIGDMSFTLEKNACGTNTILSKEVEEACLNPPKRYDHRKAIQLGLKYLSNGDMKNALKSFEGCSKPLTLYQSTGLYGECAFFKGAIYLEQKNMGKALDAFGIALSSCGYIDNDKVTNNYTCDKVIELYDFVKLDFKKKADERKRIADAKQAEADKKAAERRRIADAKEAERKRVAAVKYEEEKKYNKLPTTKLLNTYIDYLIIKNLYEGGNYYVSGSQMKQVKAITIATENYYKNSIPSTDSVWDSAVRDYEINWAEEINSLNSFSTFSTQVSGYVDLKIMVINNHASELGISNSNTTKDF